MDDNFPGNRYSVDQAESEAEDHPSPIAIATSAYAKACSEADLVAWVGRVVNQDEQALACLYDALASRVQAFGAPKPRFPPLVSRVQHPPVAPRLQLMEWTSDGRGGAGNASG